MRTASAEWIADRFKQVRAQGNMIADMHMETLFADASKFSTYGFNGTLPTEEDQSASGLRSTVSDSYPYLSIRNSNDIETYGFTIVWSDNESQYATEYKIVFYSAFDAVAASYELTNNSRISIVTPSMFPQFPQFCVSVRIIIKSWSGGGLQYAKIGAVYSGIIQRFDANNSFSLTEKNTVSIASLDASQYVLQINVPVSPNSSPSLKTGIYKRIHSGIKVDLKYAMYINGSWEYMYSGVTYYLTDWTENETSVVFECGSALDKMKEKVFSFVGNDPAYRFLTPKSGAARSLNICGFTAADIATATSNMYGGAGVEVDVSGLVESGLSCGEVMQLAANASLGTFAIIGYTPVFRRLGQMDQNQSTATVVGYDTTNTYDIGRGESIDPIYVEYSKTIEDVLVQPANQMLSGSDNIIQVYNEFLGRELSVVSSITAPYMHWLVSVFSKNVKRSCAYIGDCRLQVLDTVKLTDATGDTYIWVTSTTTKFDGTFSFEFSGVVV